MTPSVKRGLSGSTWEALAPWLTEVRLGAGEQLFCEGDEADCLYVIDQGVVDIHFEVEPDQLLERVGPGQVVGEMALLLGGTRSASGTASGEVVALRLDRQRFGVLMDERPELGRELSTALHERVRRTKLAGHLRAILGELEPEALHEIQARLQWVQLRSGEELFREGDASDGAYILALGRLEVSVEDPQTGEERVLDETGPGEWVGEMALLAQQPRSATIRALRDSELVRLSTEVFDELTARYPSALRHTACLLVDRLERHIRGAGGAPSPPRSVALVPTGPGVDLGEVARALSATLARYGTSRRIDADGVSTALAKEGVAQVGPDDPAHVQVSSWLAAQEDLHDFVVLQGDARWSRWSERAVRQADVVLLVGDGGGSPAPGEVEARLAALATTARLPEPVLVLCHDEARDSTFPGTARWLQLRPDVHRHFHLRRGVQEDVARMVRLLIGRGVGFVFAGGGSRGFAHIGVLRALDELGIPIDSAGGASVGAMIAGACGLELDWRQVQRQLPGLMQRAFRQPTLPLVSFMTGAAVLDGACALAGGDFDLEDFARPVFYVATNLSRGEPEVIRRGSSALGIRASSSIPGIFPPLTVGRKLLVDGGVSNNLPVDVMARSAGFVVGVDIIPDLELEADRPTRASTSGVRELAERLRSRGRSDMPSILSVMMRTATSSAHGLRMGAEAARPNDLILRPQLSRWNMINFASPGPIVEQGYRETREALASWWAARRAHVLGGTP